MSNPTLMQQAQKMLRHTHRLIRLLRVFNRRYRFVDASAGVEALKGFVPIPRSQEQVA